MVSFTSVASAVSTEPPQHEEHEEHELPMAAQSLPMPTDAPASDDVVHPNQKARCAAWAAVGECERNELYMAEQARGLHPISA